MPKFLFTKLSNRLWNTCEKFVCNRKVTFLGIFQSMWRIRIHATYKTGMERICHTCVTNAFEICDEFVRIFQTLWRIRANNSHVWKIRSVNIKVQQCLHGLCCFQYKWSNHLFCFSQENLPRYKPSISWWVEYIQNKVQESESYYYW